MMDLPELNTTRLRELISLQMLDAISDEEFAELESVMLSHQEAREIYRQECRIDAKLQQLSMDSFSSPQTPTNFLNRISIAGLSSVAVILAICLWMGMNKPVGSKKVAGQLKSSSAKWLSTPISLEEEIFVGQKLEIASGSAQIEFASGAILDLQGPAIFELDSSNSGYLVAGEAFARASTPESLGFAIRTRSANVIDIGTEFMIKAGLDGHSQVEVKDGEVEVEVKGFENHRILSGDSLGIEPGNNTILAKIERGNATPEFIFDTIAPPTDQDFADASNGVAKFSIPKRNKSTSEAKLHRDSGALTKLIDGKGQNRQDAPRQSVYFEDRRHKASLLLDLSKKVDISKVNTYTWHESWRDKLDSTRAVQKYTLWGYNGSGSPILENNTLSETGWIRIARVNSDAFFNVTTIEDRPAQQACSIFAEGNSLGKFRYLLFDVKATRGGPFDHPYHIFFGEIDVFAEP